MKKIVLLTTILMFASLASQAVIINPMDYKDTDKAYNDYIQRLKQHDVYITLPQNFSPVNVRGVSDVKNSIGHGEKYLNIDCHPADIEAIVEDDSCQVAICYPQIAVDFGTSKPYYPLSVHGSSAIEADLRMIHDDMDLDVRPMVNIIAEENMSQYANADTVAIYEFDMLDRLFMGNYTHAVGIYLRKKDHPSLLVRLMLRYHTVKDKDKYIRLALDNIRFGDNPSETFMGLERADSKRSDFRFPTKYRKFTGILPDINDETLEELNRVKAWCEAHGMKELPKIDDDLLEVLNRAKRSRDKSYSEADSILDSDMPEDKKILKPFMCDSWAQFPGDEELFDKYWEWLDKNIRYPKKALEKGIEGHVTVEFTVCSDGSIKDIVISNLSRNADESLKREAIRLFESMPRWTPATYKGKSVNSHEIRTVNFKLPQNKPQTDNHQQTPKQTVEESRIPEYIYDMKSIPTAPIFKGGNQGLDKWIQEHLQYPSDAAKAKIEGRVIVEFIIDKNGAVTVPKVVRGINDSLNNEALRVIKSMPRWTPGYAHGKPAKTRYTYPVTFKLAKAK